MKNDCRIVYRRVVDKSLIPTCNILGVDIAAIDMKWLINYIKDNIKDLAGDYITVANVHTVIMSMEESEYCLVQNSGIMAVPDGGPLSTLGRKRGYKGMQRITGPNLMEEIFRISVQEGYTHYFYGSTEETLLKLCKKIKVKYEGIQIVGTYSPPFRKIREEEDIVIVDDINKKNPDFIWVGLGAPKQEIWMSEHQGALNGLMIGVGAGFDYHAGNIKRAPDWMQKRNLEWLYRLMQEPRRLFKRYLYTNSKFIWQIIIKRK